MPRLGRRRAPRRARKYKRKIRRMQIVKPIHNFGPQQGAHIRESFEIQNIASNQDYGYVFCLAQFERAARIATNFKFYKPARVTWTYEPMFNTYQADSMAGTPGIPYLYSAMNRTQDNQVYVVGDYLAQGAKPKKLAKIIKMSYVPNWCSPGLLTFQVSANVPPPVGGVVQNIVQVGSKAEYGYIPCPTTFNTYSAGTTEGITPFQATTQFPNTGPNLPGFLGLGNTTAGIATNCVYFNGHKAFIEQLNKTSTIVCKCTVTVDWVFKDPLYTQGNANTDIMSFNDAGQLVPSAPLETN